MRATIHIENVRYGARQTDSGKKPYLIMSGVNERAEGIKAIAYGEIANSLNREFDEMTPEGMTIADINAAVNVEGQAEAGKKPGDGEIIIIKRFNVLKGLQLQQAQFARQAAEIDRELGDMSQETQLEVMKRFVRTVAGRLNAPRRTSSRNTQDRSGSSQITGGKGPVTENEAIFADRDGNSTPDDNSTSKESSRTTPEGNEKKAADNDLKDESVNSNPFPFGI